VYSSAIIAFGLVVTLTFDLWPWKHHQQCPLIWWIFMPRFTEIPPLSKEISYRAKLYVLTDGQRADGSNLMAIPLRIWPRYDFNYWSLTLKTFSAITTHMLNIWGNQLHSKVSRHAKMMFTYNGRTDCQTRKHIASGVNSSTTEGRT